MEIGAPLSCSQLLANKIEDIIEEIWFRHSLVMRTIGHLLPYLPLRFANGVQLFHVLWTEIRQLEIP